MSHSSQEKMGNYNADGKKEHKLMRKGLAVALAGAVALGAAGCSGDKVGAQAPEVHPSTTTEAPVAPEKEVETTEKQTNTEKYAQDMEVYRQMSVEQFEQLTLDERLVYAQFLIDKTNEGRDYEIFYADDTPGESYRIDLIEETRDNTDQEIINIYSRKNQLTILQPDPPEGSKIPLNKSEAKKLLSGVFYNVGDNHIVSYSYLNMKKTIDNTSYIFSGRPESPLASEDITEMMDGVNRENNSPVEYRDIPTSLDGEEVYYRFVFYTFINYDGNDRSIWLLDIIANSEDMPRYSGVK